MKMDEIIEGEYYYVRGSFARETGKYNLLPVRVVQALPHLDTVWVRSSTGGSGNVPRENIVAGPNAKADFILWSVTGGRAWSD